MVYDWSMLSIQQERLLRLLDFAVPLHHTHVKRAGVRANTVRSMVKLGLVRWAYYHGDGASAVPFLCLTQDGQCMRRDLERWTKRVSDAAARIVRAREG